MAHGVNQQELINNPLLPAQGAGNYGQDTEELLRRIANIQDNTLNVSGLRITSLPDLPSGLQQLFCHNTQLTSLSDLPTGLQRLSCFNTRLTSLPDLPSDLQGLWSYNTQLTSLPELPSKLIYLSCHNTQLRSLPELPSGLQELYCSYTQLTSLPDLPSGLKMLDCSYTQITSLPDLPSGLEDLWCFNTPLILQQNTSESMTDYIARCKAWRKEEEERKDRDASKKRSQERCNQVKEELMMELWKPSRIEKMLESGVEID